MGMRGVAVAVLVSVALVAGCSGSSDPDPTGTDQGTSGVRTVEAQVSGQTLVARVHPVVSVDDRAVLTVDYSVPEDSEESTSLAVGHVMLDDGIGLGTSAVRLVDLKGGRVWEVGSGPLDKTTTKDLLNVSPGDSRTSQTFFGPVDADSVGVMLPLVGLVTDVPVVKGDASTPDVASLGIDGPFEFPAPYPLESFVQAFDGDASVRQEGDEQTVTLASDVLFASDDDTLSAEADARVDATAQQVAEVASGGEVRVVGHTDDVDTDEYNLALSNRRAQAVADRLSVTLGPSYTFVVEGRGEAEPAVEGTDAVARAANRRVEIGFSATEAMQLTPHEQTVPEPTGPTTSGHSTVEYTLEGTRLKAAVPSAVRHDGYLVGTVKVSIVAGGDPDFMLGDYSDHHEQDYMAPSWVDGAWDVTLVGPSGRAYPVQYRSPPDSATVVVLADRFRWVPVKEGESFTYTVVWPDSGQDTVDIDVRNRFRITDVPVEAR